MTLTPALWQQLQALFNEALGLPIEKREAWLRAQVHVEEFLIERVITMLTADAQLEQIPEQSAASALIGEPEIRPGEKLGVYTIEKLIGAGGMGQVYLAARTDGVVAQQVAIKLLHGFGNTQELKRRFDQERRILAKLQHPGIARFLDAGTGAKGRPYVVMEYVEGESISDYCTKSKLDLPAKLALFAQVLNAVAYAHSQLIVHRDIKPSNVLVNLAGQIRLLDFGIAKPLLDLDKSLRTSEQTATALRTFSIRYAAPEQISGVASGVSCDIYALGGLLYELLTGKTALELSDKSFADAASTIQYALPILPSAHKNAALPAKLLKGDLDRICLHALKKGPNERYASAEAFLRDITCVQNGEPISLRSSVASYRFRKFVARYKLPVALAAALIFGLGTSSSVLFMQQGQLVAQRDVAKAEQLRAEQAQKRAAGVTELLLSAFRAADPSQNRGEKLLAREVIDQAALGLEDNSLDAESAVTLSTTLASVYHSLGLHDKARKLIDHALTQANAAASIAQAQLWQLNAAVYHAMGQREGRAAAIKQAGLFLKGSDPLSPDGVKQQLLEIALLRETRTSAQSQRSARQLDRDVAHRYGESHPLSVETAISVLAYTGSLERDEEVTELINNRLSGRKLDSLDINQLMLLKDRAYLHLDVGRLTEARKDIEHFGNSTERLYGKNHRAYASFLNLKARLFTDQERFNDALLTYKDLVSLIESLEGESVTLALALNNESLAYQKLSDFRPALQCLTRAKAIVLKLLPDSHRFLATIRGNLGGVYLSLAQLKNAERELLASLEIFERIFKNGQNADVDDKHLDLAEVYMRLSQHEKSKKHWCLAGFHLKGEGKSTEFKESKLRLSKAFQPFFSSQQDKIHEIDTYITHNCKL